MQTGDNRTTWKPHGKLHNKKTTQKLFSENVIKIGQRTEDIKFQQNFHSILIVVFRLSTQKTLYFHFVRDNACGKYIYIVFCFRFKMCADCSYRLLLLWLYSKQKLTRFNFVEIEIFWWRCFFPFSQLILVHCCVRNNWNHLMSICEDMKRLKDKLTICFNRL